MSDSIGPGWTKHTPGFADIYFINDLIDYGASSNGISKSIDGGNTWTVVDTSHWLFNVKCSPDGKAFFAGGTNLTISTADDGASFDTSHFSTGIMDIYFPGNNIGYAIGQQNGFFKTIDGGITWNLVQPLTGLQTSSSYSSLFFINNTTGWIINNSSIFRTNGSVNSWLEANFNINPTGMFTGIYAPSANIIYAVTEDGKVYKSADGGINFSLMIDFPETGFNDIHFVDDNTGYVSIDRKIYKTIDGGAHWQTVVAIVSGIFIELHFTDAGHGWACATDSTSGGIGNLFIYNP